MALSWLYWRLKEKWQNCYDFKAINMFNDESHCETSTKLDHENSLDELEILQN